MEEVNTISQENEINKRPFECISSKGRLCVLRLSISRPTEHERSGLHKLVVNMFSIRYNVFCNIFPMEN